MCHHGQVGLDVQLRIGSRVGQGVCWRLANFFLIFGEHVLLWFRGATDTPVLDFMVVSALDFQRHAWISSLACAQLMPQIHLWCDTC